MRRPTYYRRLPTPCGYRRHLDDARIRSIAARDLLRKLAAKALARQYKATLRRHVEPFDFGISDRSGTDAAIFSRGANDNATVDIVASPNRRTRHETIARDIEPHVCSGLHRTETAVRLARGGGLETGPRGTRGRAEGI